LLIFLGDLVEEMLAVELLMEVADSVETLVESLILVGD
jgi:hypothetical protein